MFEATLTEAEDEADKELMRLFINNMEAESLGKKQKLIIHNKHKMTLIFENILIYKSILNNKCLIKLLT